MSEWLALGISLAGAALGQAAAAAGPSRPALGGPSPGGGTSPEATPAAGGGATPAPEGTDVTMLVSVAMLVFGVVGYVRGARRATPTLVAAALIYATLATQWAQVVRWNNHFYRLFVFAVLRRGILADDPTQLWAEMKDMPTPVPADGDSPEWQIVFFVTQLVGVYVLTHIAFEAPKKPVYVLRLGNIFDRLAGAAAGALTGLLIGRFLLLRLVPDAYVRLFDPGSVLYGPLTQIGPAGFLLIVMLVILFGVVNLSKGRRPRLYT